MADDFCLEGEEGQNSEDDSIGFSSSADVPSYNPFVQLRLKR